MKEVKVFTVSSFNDDIVIEKYLKTVTYHIVIGMNFFADFMQSFTDVFGGKSDSYQKRLREINAEVINGIKQEVHKVGGNCAIDLKIDNDEISAKGKSMIMVTAIATAVIINKENENTYSDESLIDDFTITHGKLSHTIQMLTYKQELANKMGKKVDLDSLFHHDNLKANDIYKELLIPSKKFLLDAIDNNNKLFDWTNTIELILNMHTPENRRDFIYEFMEDILKKLNDSNFTIIKFYLAKCLQIYLNLRLVDNEKSYEWFQMKETHFKLLGLMLMGYKKNEYSKNDLSIYGKIHQDLVSELANKDMGLDEQISKNKMFEVSNIQTYLTLFKRRIDALEYIYN